MQSKFFYRGSFVGSIIQCSERKLLVQSFKQTSPFWRGSSEPPHLHLSGWLAGC